MPDCPSCGHAAGDVRFCPRCGHGVASPADDRTDTAERPSVPHTAPGDSPPPPLPPAPTSARYPLFADEAAPAPALGSTTAELPVPAAAPETAAAPPARGRPAWLPWVLAAAVLVLVAGLGVWLLGGDDPGPDDDADRRAAAGARDGEAVDVARSATAVVPATAPPNQDVDGNLVRYEARQMLDGVPETTWRMPGDGTGRTLVFELDSPAALSEVGLVNGYAKTAQDGGRTFDWYAGNRRVLAVEWVFDDGTTLTQDLDETRDLQTVAVDRVTTSTVELRLVTVSAPGTGASSRDYTAISEVSLTGVPG